MKQECAFDAAYRASHGVDVAMGEIDCVVQCISDLTDALKAHIFFLKEEIDSRDGRIAELEERISEFLKDGRDSLC